jgi:hypothetical protein
MESITGNINVLQYHYFRNEKILGLLVWMEQLRDNTTKTDELIPQYAHHFFPQTMRVQCFEAILQTRKGHEGTFLYHTMQ